MQRLFTVAMLREDRAPQECDPSTRFPRAGFTITHPVHVEGTSCPGVDGVFSCMGCFPACILYRYTCIVTA